jgi:hypothetical protein
VLLCVPMALDLLPVLESTVITLCLMAPGMPPARRGLWCRHVSHGSRPAPDTEGSDVTTCPVAPDPPPGREGPRCCHVSYNSRPASQCGRAVASPRALWLSASEAWPCILKAPDIRLIMASSGTRSRQHIKCI